MRSAVLLAASLALAASATASNMGGSNFRLNRIDAGVKLSHAELSAAATRVARELSGEASPMSVDADDGSASWLLGHEGRDGVLLVSGPVMGHLLMPAELPGHGGRLLRIPQVAIGVRHLIPDGDLRCGVAVLEFQLDERGGFHAGGLRSLEWADPEEHPHVCGVLTSREQRAEGDDLLIFAIDARDERDGMEGELTHSETMRIALLPGGFESVGELTISGGSAGASRGPLELRYFGVDETEVRRVVETERSTAFVAELSEAWPAVQVRERVGNWGWTHLELTGPDTDVTAFLAALVEDVRAESVTMVTSIRTGGTSTTRVRLRGAE